MNVPMKCPACGMVVLVDEDEIEQASCELDGAAFVAAQAGEYDPSDPLPHWPMALDFRHRNRVPRNQKLAVLQIVIEHADGILTTDPNGLIGLVLDGTLLKLKPYPDLASVLSGKPAVLHREYDLEIPLTPEEVHRLADRSLTPDEFKKLMIRYGMAHAWHEDFYDLLSGEAMQPVSKR